MGLLNFTMKSKNTIEVNRNEEKLKGRHKCNLLNLRASVDMPMNQHRPVSQMQRRTAPNNNSVSITTANLNLKIHTPLQKADLDNHRGLVGRIL